MVFEVAREERLKGLTAWGLCSFGRMPGEGKALFFSVDKRHRTFIYKGPPAELLCFFTSGSKQSDIHSKGSLVVNMSDQLAGWTKRLNVFGHRVIGGPRIKSQDVDHAGEPSVHDRRCGSM